MGFSRQEYWSGLPYPPPGDLPNPGIEPTFLTSSALAAGLFTTSATLMQQSNLTSLSVLCQMRGAFHFLQRASNPTQIHSILLKGREKNEN